MKPQSIRDVAEGHLCSGCGTCAYLEPDTITLVNITDRGIRPLVAPGATTRADTLEACPGANLTRTIDPETPGLLTQLTEAWGPVLGLWEGFATDSQLRYDGSSAGAATVLAMYCLAAEKMTGVVHIGADPSAPYLNTTLFSTTPEQLLSATGSRYAPASPCDRLADIENADGPCVFIGKPCDVAGANAAAEIRPRLKDKLGLTIALFCAGTPSTRGTLEMLQAMGVEDPSRAREVRYRGRGWPGNATVTTDDGTHASLTYEESWGAILQKHRQWRCYVCVDHTGEFADIAVGDPWYREVDRSNPGRSLIVARTERGRRIIEAALASGLLTAEPVAADILPRSQPNLANTRGAVWMRLQVSKLFGVYVPTYRNMAMFQSWRKELTPLEKIRSVTGTVRRVFRKKLRHRAPVRGEEALGHAPRRSPS